MPLEVADLAPQPHAAQGRIRRQRPSDIFIEVADLQNPLRHREASPLFVYSLPYSTFRRFNGIFQQHGDDSDSGSSSGSGSKYSYSSDDCFVCGDDGATYEYGGYDVCWDCYYDLKYGSDSYSSDDCYVCGDDDATYEFGGYDVCWDCYYELKYGNDDGCFICGDSNPNYEYGGYDVCWDCYYDLKYGD